MLERLQCCGATIHVRSELYQQYTFTCGKCGRRLYPKDQTINEPRKAAIERAGYDWMGLAEALHATAFLPDDYAGGGAGYFSPDIAANHLEQTISRDFVPRGEYEALKLSWKERIEDMDLYSNEHIDQLVEADIEATLKHQRKIAETELLIRRHLPLVRDHHTKQVLGAILKLIDLKTTS